MSHFIIQCQLLIYDPISSLGSGLALRSGLAFGAGMNWTVYKIIICRLLLQWFWASTRMCQSFDMFHEIYNYETDL